MIKGKTIALSCCTLLLLLTTPALAHSSRETGDYLTPFRNGRWITGLSGSINTGTSSLAATGAEGIRNEYSLDFRTGKFVRDRLLVGGTLSMSRANYVEFQARKLEKMHAGPLLTWYLTEGNQGSLFITGAGVFVKFRDESNLVQGSQPSLYLVDGLGGGVLLRFGYSYVLHDRVAFDLGLNFSNSWLSADVIDESSGSHSKENFAVIDLTFSFGFSVILDNFFF